MPRTHFQQQLANLKNKLLAMAALAQQAVDSSVQACVGRDATLCQYVRENETAINLAQREVDEMAYELLAQEQPMAIDLRFLLAVIKINSNLERIGDQAMGIAERTLDLIDAEPVELPVDFEAMLDCAARMIRLALQALLEADDALADAVIVMDDDIDRMNRLAHEDLIALIQTRPAIAQQALHSIMISRHLERIADYGTDIAGNVVFWVRGADLRHQKTA